MESNIKQRKSKSTAIDFSKLSDEYPDGPNNPSKKERLFKYLPLPNEEIRRLYNETV